MAGGSGWRRPVVEDWEGILPPIFSTTAILELKRVKICRERQK
jgi:hypothetical protein